MFCLSYKKNQPNTSTQPVAPDSQPRPPSLVEDVGIRDNQSVSQHVTEMNPVMLPNKVMCKCSDLKQESQINGHSEKSMRFVTLKRFEALS